MKIFLVLYFCLVILASCNEESCFCEEDIVIYNNSFEPSEYMAGWSDAKHLVKKKSNFIQLGESSLYILNNTLNPSARLEFISRYAGKVKIKFDAFAYDDKTEIVFRNISNPEQLIIPLISNSLSHYEFNKYIDVSAENTLSLEVYSSSALDTLLILDNIKMVIMK